MIDFLLGLLMILAAASVFVFVERAAAPDQTEVDARRRIADAYCRSLEGRPSPVEETE